MSQPVTAIGEPVRALAARLGLPWQPEADADTILCLAMRDEGLALSGDTRRYGAAPIRVDFTAGKVAHRRRFGGGRGQLIAKACGLAHGVTPSIVDATAGLGRDAFVLASLGAQVLLIERVAAIYALLGDGVRRARADEEAAEIVARMRVANGDAARELATLVARHDVAPQVVHLDPMFPHRDKSALVKKEMRVFRELAGDDDDAPRLLEAALEVATHRVVVKRPRRAPPLEGPSPDHVLEGKTSRYDLYVHRSLKPA
ncbi:class I SAM-dependent methyltransferase [Chromohalobacter sp. TMW 2.2308]|uniref:Ribosomal RNA small subunit methyltransferase J n=1 Tax=Chromohalobacter moromii TaxID=2860329 RepID=A0A9X2X164_9GAMM|nr:MULTISPECIES: class I SAM-dependent methyltransferase [Chromohalobacter]MCK2041410.1 class I SAM-dependent methyltransferase [Chromohalobacter moromii]MCK2044351.1 class I SAM-dependent methyltransferase [Chromohalobacter moromii]MCT8504489.1 class I SAM-dependent methyltransferase [Chromohalobacter moromii]MCT8513558.1 class I SAM-dependent methyltransferase [Chromohalobacter sp. TMW 2.2271]